MGKCICPKCKSENVIPVIYGYPSHEDFEEAEKGNLKLGGCDILIDGFAMPDRFCKDCKTKWCVDRLEADAIKKVRFKYWSNWGFYEPDSIVEAQWVFEIFKDGTIKYFAYPRASRRVLDKEIVHIEKDRVADFYQNVIWLYRPSTEIIECKVCDGCSYELTITYKDNRKKKMHGDLGGGTVDKTVTNFLCTIPKMKARIEGCGIENEDC